MDDGPQPDTSGMSRRRFLGLLGAGTGSFLLVEAPTLLGGPLADEAGATTTPAPTGLLVVRAEDGLYLTLTFTNLDVSAPRSKPLKLVLRDRTMPGYVTFGLPPQAIAEQAVFDPPGVAPTPPVASELAGASRLVVTVPAGSAPFPYDLGRLLDLARFPLSVSDVARSGATGPIAGPPSDLETALEAPWRLILSPAAGVAFTTAQGLVTRAGRTELWHARAARVADGAPLQSPHTLPVRAVWTPDLTEALPGGPGFPVGDTPSSAVALTPQDRREIVAATTTDQNPGDPVGRAAPAQASLLLVSPMGASLDLNGVWDDRTDITQWRHRSWLGRDNFVQVDTPGFLFPLGFPAVLVRVTERVVLDGIAVLRKRQYVKVRRPTITYPVPGLQPNEGRNQPFTTVVTSTLFTPPLTSTPELLGAGLWVQVELPGGALQDVRFDLRLAGRDGAVVSSALPLLFVEAEDAFDRGKMVVLAGLYGGVPAVRRTLALDGQKLAYVPRRAAAADEPPPEDPALPTSGVVLGAETSAKDSLKAERMLNAFPVMQSADVRIEALDALGGAGGTTIVLAEKYRTNGLGGAANPGEVWAEIPGAKPALAVPQETAGGLAAPALAAEGLSRAFGPAADLANIAEGNFDPEKYFDLGVNLLGGILLSDVVQAVNGITNPFGDQGDKVPKVVTVRTDDALDTVITWRPELKKVANDLFVPGTGEDARLFLKAVLHTDLGNPGAVTSTVTGDLRNFTLNFVGTTDPLYFISQKVVRLHFESRNGAKPTIDVQLGESTFEGQLKFLAELKNYLPAMPGGVRIDITPRGVSAGLQIAIPSVSIGVLLVQNISIGVLFDLPFNGDQATLTFSFATRENPFRVTVSALGGGGFLAVGIGTRDVQSIEGALEFGAAVAIDLGVASGSVSIMAGIYFKYAQLTGPDGSKGGSTVVITGYVRAVGELEVLGLITVSVEFYLGLTYSDTNGQKKVEGEGRLTVRVEVAFFSKSVSVSMRKEFGGGADPPFGAQITSGDWATYCAAFAPS